MVVQIVDGKLDRDEVDGSRAFRKTLAPAFPEVGFGIAAVQHDDPIVLGKYGCLKIFRGSLEIAVRLRVPVFNVLAIPAPKNVIPSGKSHSAPVTSMTGINHHIDRWVFQSVLEEALRIRGD